MDCIASFSKFGWTLNNGLRKGDEEGGLERLKVKEPDWQTQVETSEREGRHYRDRVRDRERQRFNKMSTAHYD